MRHTLKASFNHQSDARHVLDELLASGYSRADMTTYREAHVPERHLVTLTADSEPDAERVVGILKRFGPVGIEDVLDERDQGSVGWNLSGPGTEASGTRPMYRPGTGPGALQYRAHEDSPYFGTQKAEAPPTGNTFQEPSSMASPWSDLEAEAAWEVRLPGQLSTGDKARDAVNPGGSDVENDLKGGWEPAQGGSAPSVWNKMKAAVHHGWNRAKR